MHNAVRSSTCSSIIFINYIIVCCFFNLEIVYQIFLHIIYYIEARMLKYRF